MPDIPESFTDPAQEYRALVERVALINPSHWGVLRLTGGDRATYLHSQVTSNITSLEPGQGSHATLTTVKGKLVAELFVLARPSELLVLVSQGDTTTVFDALCKYIIADDVTLEDVSADHAVFSLEGPDARAMVWRLFPDGPLPMEALAFGDTDYQGIPVTVLRNSVTGGRGFQLIVSGDGEGRDRIHEYLVQGGLGLDMERCGRAAWNMRRVEMGLPWWGSDVDDNFPKECRLDHTIDYEKGCFLGQETLARMHYRGHPNWLLVGLAPVGDVPEALRLSAADTENPTPVDPATLDLSRLAGAELFAPGDDGDKRKAVGRITSPVFSPGRGAFLSLGYVRHNLAEPGTRFEWPRDGETVELEVITLPIDHHTAD